MTAETCCTPRFLLFVGFGVVLVGVGASLWALSRVRAGRAEMPDAEWTSRAMQQAIQVDSAFAVAIGTRDRVMHLSGGAKGRLPSEVELSEIVRGEIIAILPEADRPPGTLAWTRRDGGVKTPCGVVYVVSVPRGATGDSLPAVVVMLEQDNDLGVRSVISSEAVGTVVGRQFRDGQSWGDVFKSDFDAVRPAAPASLREQHFVTYVDARREALAR